MKTLLSLLGLLALISAAACHAPRPEPAGSAARPEIRYYVIADT